ncbi:N-acetylmuramoyl-L-alanine amidase [Algoriphagus sp. D3-2-R+10]|uniref:N-acetylmuramoyl-L-alanine amidase family protein n=1 Tax=Algoriphagus aurantiacus TaxID=3103948 RepID=UPI002B3D7E77|nr:N-acetylmuramoyl-L-alanine amidase [Algoriphagus sp. D3-2-R+10]MEB2774827.1 N-acetylmuramoyl-L-alanine amidase [Algoriphagus sp. D3-2-R+10]
MSIIIKSILFFSFFVFFSLTDLVGQSGPYQEVTAKEGDGIFMLLRENGLNPATHLQSFLELNQQNLGENNSLYKGRSYLLPNKVDSTANVQLAANTKETSPSTIDISVKEDAAKSALEDKSMVLDVPFFGKKYERLEIIDQSLKGAVYYLLSGHGGPDPGAMSKYGSYLLAEDEYAYDVSIRLARRLMEHGATVYMIIQDEDDGIRDESILLNDTDERCYPDEIIPLNQKERLRQRTNAVNKLYRKHKGSYQRMMAIHVDSRSKSENIDVFFYHHENSPSGKKLATNIHEKIKSKYDRHQPNRGYTGSVSTRSSLYVIKYSHPPAIFVELGNIKNEKDQRRFVIADNRQALANWLFEGMLSDYAKEKK